jgi:hypothetical protein
MINRRGDVQFNGQVEQRFGFVEIVASKPVIEAR